MAQEYVSIIYINQPVEYAVLLLFVNITFVKRIAESVVGLQFVNIIDKERTVKSAKDLQSVTIVARGLMHVLEIQSTTATVPPASNASSQKIPVPISSMNTPKRSA